MATEVKIVDYDSHWPQHFMEAQHKLSSILMVPLSSIEHVGSTAVPGLAAKPLIDIDITMIDDKSILHACLQLERAGYQPRGARYGDGVFAFLLAGTPGYRVYLCPSASETHRKRILFRDYLRQDTHLAKNYAVLKRQLSETYRYDGDAYTQAKSAFIAKAIHVTR